VRRRSFLKGLGALLGISQVPFIPKKEEVVFHLPDIGGIPEGWAECNGQPIIVPIIRRLQPNMLAFDMFGVQPMGPGAQCTDWDAPVFVLPDPKKVVDI